MSAPTLEQSRTPRSRTAPPGETDHRRREVPGRSAPTRAAPARGTQARRSTSTGQGRSGQARAPRARARDDLRTGGTAPFVLLIMVLLTSGLVATLWLSTAAAADSYRLDSERRLARDLSEQTERLHRDVETARSAPAIAAAAQRDGMVPAGEPTVLLVAPNGSTRVIGAPRPARAASASPPPTTSSPLGAQPPDAAPSTPRSVADPEAVAQTGAGQGGTTR